MKQSLRKKLAAYTSIATPFLLTQYSATSQIVYTDIVPNIHFLHDANYDLDLNNDSIVDYTIKFRTNSTTNGTDYYRTNSAMMWYFSNNLVAGISTNFSYLAKVLNYGDVIDNNQTWVNHVYMTIARYRKEDGNENYYGYWFDAQDKYVGLKFFVDTNVYYGWVRLTISSNADEMWIKDYAYEVQPNQPIIAGDTVDFPTNISEAADGKIKFKSEINFFEVFIEDHTLLDGNLIIRNMIGELQLRTSINQNIFRLNTNELTNGLYIATYQKGNTIYSKKFVVE